jgi:hypothetical protein
MTCGLWVILLDLQRPTNGPSCKLHTDALKGPRENLPLVVGCSPLYYSVKPLSSLTQQEKLHHNLFV